jgi:hypothetical protein
MFRLFLINSEMFSLVSTVVIFFPCPHTTFIAGLFLFLECFWGAHISFLWVYLWSPPHYHLNPARHASVSVAVFLPSPFFNLKICHYFWSTGTLWVMSSIPISGHLPNNSNNILLFSFLLHFCILFLLCCY